MERAFPRPLSKLSSEEISNDQDGMTLRDYFAGQALAGHCARIHVPVIDGDWPSAADMARWAYEQADAMLAERAKGGQ
jgi:hypothetical protein